MSWGHKLWAGPPRIRPGLPKELSVRKPLSKPSQPPPRQQGPAAEWELALREGTLGLRDQHQPANGCLPHPQVGSNFNSSTVYLTGGGSKSHLELAWLALCLGNGTFSLPAPAVQQGTPEGGCSRCWPCQHAVHPAFTHHQRKPFHRARALPGRTGGSSSL